MEKTNQLDYEFRCVTPSQAKKWLKNNELNRRLERRRVDRLVRELQAGNWKMNGDSIRFYDDGTLADGQHRLTAVVESGVSINSLVIRHLPKEVMPTIDRGRTRKTTDVLRMAGYENTERLAGALPYIVGFLEYGDPMKSGTVPFSLHVFSDQSMFDLLENHPAIQESADRMTLYHKAQRILTPSTATALYFMFRSIDENDADSFFEDLDTGLGLTANDPVYRLRERILRDRGDQNKRGKNIYRSWMRLAGAAWNMRRRGKPCKVLQLQSHWVKLI
tara:strand:- start:104 stop:931 length:828 start_codon:yes stop_codon:yes gene_type:complete